MNKHTLNAEAEAALLGFEVSTLFQDADKFHALVDLIAAHARDEEPTVDRSLLPNGLVPSGDAVRYAAKQLSKELRRRLDGIDHHLKQIDRAEMAKEFG